MKYIESLLTARIGYDFYCDIANRIVEARKYKGWTQERLAKEAKIPLSRLQRIELVQIKIKLDTIETLARCLDVTVNWLICAEPDSQIGDCLYLVWPEFCPEFKLYQKGSSKRMAYLLHEKRLNEELKVRANTPRERVFVKLVGIPVTKSEIQDKFRKLPDGDEEIYPDAPEKEGGGES